MLMKHFFLILIVVLSTFPALAQKVNYKGFKANDINDIVLIYYGGSIHRLSWTPEHFVPYLTHTFQDGRKEWLFPGFIFLEFSMHGRFLIHMNKPETVYATKREWQELIDKTFEKGHALDALDKSIEQQKKELGNPPFRHKVMLCIPSPIDGQKNWGSLNGKRLDFSIESHKNMALKWYIEQMLNLFQQSHYKNIDLEGFYWVQEGVWKKNGVLNFTASLLKRNGMNFYWIPYYNSPGSEQWEKYGFTYSYIQPNYFFRPKMQQERFLQALETAKKVGCGVEMEIDDKLLNTPQVFLPRLRTYIDLFEREGVYDSNASIAYYEGGGTMWRLYKNRFPKNISSAQRKAVKEQIDRMAKHIVNRNHSRKKGGKRQKSTNWTDPEYWHF